MREEEYALFSEIENNIADEAEARQGYYLLRKNIAIFSLIQKWKI